MYIKPMYYTKILDHDGNVLIDNTTTARTRRVLKDTTAYLLTSAMEDVVTKGTGAKVNFGNMAIAGKTGTTTSNVDVWFSGFTPYYTCCTWSGYDNNVHMNGSGETNTAKILWKAIMGRIHENKEYKSFTMPEGITTATVCKRTGGLATAICRADGSAITEYFAEGTVPELPCNNHYGSVFDTGLVCAMTGQKATATCPYAYQGVPTADGFCPHSTINGVSAQDYYNLIQMQAAGLVPVEGLPAVDPNAPAVDPNAIPAVPAVDPNAVPVDPNAVPAVPAAPAVDPAQQALLEQLQQAQ